MANSDLSTNNPVTYADHILCKLQPQLCCSLGILTDPKCDTDDGRVSPAGQPTYLQLHTDRRKNINTELLGKIIITMCESIFYDRNKF